MIRKVVKIIAIAFAVLLLLLIVLPVIFKGKIVDRVKQEVNNQLDARVEFGAFGMSLIRNFPNATLWVRDFRVIGEGAFKKDTLADIGRIMVSFDVLSLFRGSDYEINRIRLDNPRFLFKLLADGSANYDIMIDTGDSLETEAPSDFSLSLNRVEINKGYVAYHDDLYVTYVEASDINGVFRANMKGAVTTITTRDATIASFSLRYDQWPVLSRVRALLTAEMDADLDRMVFTFRDNLIQLNELPLVFEGMVGWPVDDLEMDFQFGAARSDFASFISLVPALYMKDFDQLKTAGSMKLEGHVRGGYTEASYPGFGLSLVIDNGMFQYPGLPASVDNVNVTANITNPGEDLDLTVVDIPRFGVRLAGTPIEARFHLERPMSNPQFDTKITGTLDLSMVEQYYPLEDGYVLKGLIDSDLEMRGKLSSFEQSDYDAVYASGKFVAKEVVVKAPMLEDQLEIDLADLRFNPKQVKLEAFRMRLGQNDLAATGEIHNLPGYLFDDQLLKGSFTAQSSFFDLNTIMEDVPEIAESADSPAGGRTDETGSMSAIRIPANIDVTLDSRFDMVRFGKLQLANVQGVIHVAEEQAVMDKLRMDMLGGSLELNGFYDSRDVQPYINLALNILGFDIRQTFEGFNTVQILAPIAEYARGAFSANLKISSLLGEGLMPVLTSLKGKGGLRSSAVLLQNTPSMSLLADQLHMDQFREMSLKDLALSFAFADGKLELPPMDLRFGDITANIAGVTYFDKRITYAMRINVPRAMFGSSANQVLNDLVTKAAGIGLQISPSETVNLDVGIGGTFLKPEISLSMASLRSNIEDQLRLEADRLLQEAETRIRDELDQVREGVDTQIQEQIDETREKVDAEVEKRVAEVMAEANRQAANVRTQAGNAADGVRKEAASQAKKLEQEASGPLAQAAARQAGQQLVREAERRALQIEAEGERNAQRLIDEANAQAERIRRE